MTTVFGTDNPALSEHTRRLTGWSPNHWTVVEDLDRGDHFGASA